MNQEGFGVFVMFLIIIIDIAVIGLVMRWGVKHDEHQNVKEVHASKSISRLYELYGAPPAAAVDTPEKAKPVASSAMPDVNVEKQASELHKAVEELEQKVE